MRSGAWWSAWTWDPQVLLCLALVAWNYGAGVAALWRRAGVGRGIGRKQVAWFAVGMLSLVIALDSPVDALAGDLVWVHMVQHLLLIVVAAPLLVLGRPHTALLWALPSSGRRRVGRWWRHSRPIKVTWRFVSAPLVVLIAHTAALWIWHLPALYQAAVENEGLHAFEHLCFLGTALLLWWTLIHPGALGRGLSVLLVFLTGMQSVVLGVLFTFAQTPWYPVYAGRTAAWGLTPLQDQQLAGVIMWVPAGTVYIVAAAALFVAWLRDMERGIAWDENDRADASPVSPIGLPEQAPA